MTAFRFTPAVAALTLAMTPAGGHAQQAPARVPVGNPLGLPIMPSADGRFEAMSRNVKVYGSVYSAESCSYDPGRGLIVIPNRGVPQQVRANDAWITLMNRDGSIHTSRWIGIQNAGAQRDSAGLVLNEPYGSEIAGGILYLADRDGGTGPNDSIVSVIRRFDMRTGAPLTPTRVPGAPWFNDIAVDRDGTVYATATGANQVWRVPTAGSAAVFAQAAPLSRPNGVAIDRDGNIVVVNSGDDAVLTFSRDGAVLRTERAAQAGSDGIVIMEDGTKYVTSVVNGGVSRIPPGQPAELIARNIPNAASMCLDPQGRQLVIPMNANNAVALVSIAPPAAAANTPPSTPTPPPAGHTTNPFPDPIPAREGAITVSVRDFASLPEVDGVAARAMTLVEEPGGRRLWVSDMHGIIYVASTDGRTVTPYLDLRDPKWRLAVQSAGRERGLQSFALHPQFSQRGTPGYGKFYTYADVSDQWPAADFTTPNANTTHDTAILEWTAASATATTYDGAQPRELIRLRQPFANHNGGALAFNPLARRGSADFGLLYIGIGDGGSGGDPMNLAQNLGSAFGKIFRIDPLGKNGRGGKYGVPASNPFLATEGALPEIFAYGMRNSQRFAWDAKNGAMFLSDIGQNVVEEVSPLTAGANLGWNSWEGSFRYMGRTGVSTESPRSDTKVTYPVVEWDQTDPVLLASGSSASVGLVIYRSRLVPQLTNRMVFSDMPSGEVFHVSADKLPAGGQSAIRRVLFTTGAGTEPRPILAIIQETNRAQGRTPATRADLRFDMTAAGRIFLLNKADGVIRVVER